jgi:hypothetical protein
VQCTLLPALSQPACPSACRLRSSLVSVSRINGNYEAALAQAETADDVQ